MTVKNVKRLVLAALAGSPLIAAAQQPARPFDILITNARMIDGTGAPAAVGWVGVRDGKIVEVGTVSGPAATTIDAGGKALAPGFIDPHSHSDYALLVDGNAESKIRQGVTTEVIGESGSVAPRLKGSDQDLLGSGLAADWTDFAGYFAAVERSKTAVNLLSYVGLGQVREVVMDN